MVRRHWRRLPPGLRQFICYGGIGGVSFIADFLFYTFLTRVSGIYYIEANVLSFLTIGSLNFLANRWLTFAHRGRPKLGQYLRFFTVAGGGLVLNTGILVLLVREFGIYDLLAKACAAALVLFWNFGMNRYWTFRHLPEEALVTACKAG